LFLFNLSKSFWIEIKNPFDLLKRILKIYDLITHSILNSLESKYENDDDVID